MSRTSLDATIRPARDAQGLELGLLQVKRAPVKYVPPSSYARQPRPKSEVFIKPEERPFLEAHRTSLILKSETQGTMGTLALTRVPGPKTSEHVDPPTREHTTEKKNTFASQKLRNLSDEERRLFELSFIEFAKSGPPKKHHDENPQPILTAKTSEDPGETSTLWECGGGGSSAETVEPKFSIENALKDITISPQLSTEEQDVVRRVFGLENSLNVKKLSQLITLSTSSIGSTAIASSLFEPLIQLKTNRVLMDTTLGNPNYVNTLSFCNDIRQRLLEAAEEDLYGVGIYPVIHLSSFSNDFPSNAAELIEAVSLSWLNRFRDRRYPKLREDFDAYMSSAPAYATSSHDLNGSQITAFAAAVKSREEAEAMLERIILACTLTNPLLVNSYLKKSLSTIDELNLCTNEELKKKLSMSLDCGSKTNSIWLYAYKVNYERFEQRVEADEAEQLLEIGVRQRSKGNSGRNKKQFGSVNQTQARERCMQFAQYATSNSLSNFAKNAVLSSIINAAQNSGIPDNELFEDVQNFVSKGPKFNIKRKNENPDDIDILLNTDLGMDIGSAVVGDEDERLYATRGGNDETEELFSKNTLATRLDRFKLANLLSDLIIEHFLTGRGPFKMAQDLVASPVSISKHYTWIPSALLQLLDEIGLENTFLCVNIPLSKSSSDVESVALARSLCELLSDANELEQSSKVFQNNTKPSVDEKRTATTSSSAIVALQQEQNSLENALLKNQTEDMNSPNFVKKESEAKSHAQHEAKQKISSEGFKDILTDWTKTVAYPISQQLDRDSVNKQGINEHAIDPLALETAKILERVEAGFVERRSEAIVRAHDSLTAQQGRQVLSTLGDEATRLANEVRRAYLARADELRKCFQKPEMVSDFCKSVGLIEALKSKLDLHEECMSLGQKLAAAAAEAASGIKTAVTSKDSSRNQIGTSSERATGYPVSSPSTLDLISQASQGNDSHPNWFLNSASNSEKVHILVRLTLYVCAGLIGISHSEWNDLLHSIQRLGVDAGSQRIAYEQSKSPGNSFIMGKEIGKENEALLLQKPLINGKLLLDRFTNLLRDVDLVSLGSLETSGNPSVVSNRNRFACFDLLANEPALNVRTLKDISPSLSIILAWCLLIVRSHFAWLQVREQLLASARNLITQKPLQNDTIDRISTSVLHPANDPSSKDESNMTLIDGSKELVSSSLPTHGRRRPSSQNRNDQIDKNSIHERLYAASRGRSRGSKT